MKRSALFAFLALGALLAVSPPRRLAAQVGTPPDRSPYHDILHGNGWTVAFGQVNGNGGPLRLSPNQGQSFGVRYDIRFSGLLQGFAELSYLKTQSQVLAPDDSVVHRYSGPFDAPVWTPQIGLELNLTGAKTWHGLAPFLGVGVGAAVGERVVQDTTSFRFGTKLLVTPAAGVRVFLGQRVHLRLEGQFYYWKMKYPTSWLGEPAAQPSVPPEPTTAPLRSTNDLDDWVATPAIRLGIGFTF
jgi:hypothetical protein